jgi:hypothetical protein
MSSRRTVIRPRFRCLLIIGTIITKPQLLYMCQRDGLHQLHDRLYTEKSWRSDALISPALVILYFGRREGGRVLGLLGVTLSKV